MMIGKQMSLIRQTMIAVVVVALMMCDWMLAVSMSPLSYDTFTADEFSVNVGNCEDGNVAAIQGETLSIPQCSSSESGYHSVSSPKKLRSHSSDERILSSVTSHHSFHVSQPLFSKSGTAFVSSRASNYYVFALRHLLC